MVWIPPKVSMKHKRNISNGFSGYHQIRIAKEHRHETTFVTEWGCFQYIVMPFGFKNAPAIFSWVVVTTFKYFIQNFLQVNMDVWTVYGLIGDHLENLWFMWECCRQHQIMLNSKKCIFCAPFRMLLGHIVCNQGLLVEPAKISLVLILPSPTNVKQFRTKLGHTGYYRKFISGYVVITSPTESLLKKDVAFVWS